MSPLEEKKPRERKKCCLVVLDGWGYNAEHSPDVKDAIALAHPRTMQKLSRHACSALLYAHGTHVGLATDAMMGNSEVGHLSIGAGRVVVQDSVRIRKAFESGDTQHIVQKALKDRAERIHVLGILSDGNVHGHWKDMLDLARLASKACTQVCVHTVSDGRDTRPQEYLACLEEFVKHLPKNAAAVSVSGRFYAMDRDGRDERTSLAYTALTSPASSSKHSSFDSSACADTLRQYVVSQYALGNTDEFIRPFSVEGCGIEKGEKVLLANFRIDRVKQMYAKLKTHAEVYTMTRVFPDQPERSVLFERPPVCNTLGDVVEEHGLSQARIAETEKQAHVTYFFDGGASKERKKETRHIVPSPRVSTYDTAPGMSAAGVKDAICLEMVKGTDFICANFANPDMVGHTGSLEATIQAVQITDAMVEEVYMQAMHSGYYLVVTADHGNAEIMADSRGPVKSHTTSQVPVIIVSPQDLSVPPGTHTPPHASDTPWGFAPLPDGSLADVAPTILELLGLPQPSEMTGHSLLPFFAS
ncbi:2,3-bisphosphoglycerate-independent phosphoglycerate mutase [Nematocida sp. AWRm77]|nr:2,3-bisphosphoglycerate-independent phosphoglycerate mutase [Nematocida sp. AWRm77]